MISFAFLAFKSALPLMVSSPNPGIPYVFTAVKYVLLKMGSEVL